MTRVRQNLGLQMDVVVPLPRKLHATLTFDEPGALLLTAVVKVVLPMNMPNCTQHAPAI